MSKPIKSGRTDFFMIICLFSLTLDFQEAQKVYILYGEQNIFYILGIPAACRGHKTDGVSPVESRSITPQGGEAVALPFGRPRGSNPVVDIT